jgi:preprotein translocase subunit SecG
MEYYNTVSPAKLDMLPYITFGLSIFFFVVIIMLSRMYGKDRRSENLMKKEIRT